MDTMRGTGIDCSRAWVCEKKGCLQALPVEMIDVVEGEQIETMLGVIAASIAERAKVPIKIHL